MACFFKYADKTKITIPRVEDRDGYTVYEIEVEIGSVKWTVSHRYKNFVQLHDALVSGHGVAKDFLPPKKILGNKEPSFIEKRRVGLETYLSILVRFLQKTMPKELAHFLDFHHYDVLFILQNLAEEFFIQGEELLLKRSHKFTCLELHAISERLKQPCPIFGPMDQRQDFSHVLDYCSRLPELTVEGCSSAFLRSNIIPNELPFDFTSFKTLKKLNLSNVNCGMITDLGELRSTLESIEIINSNLTHLSQFLLCDQIHKNEVDLNGPCVFTSISSANFTSNQLVDIDKSVQLLPNAEVLNFENNKLEEIEYLGSLIKLKTLNLSCNHFKNIQNLERKLCKIMHLDLSQNFLTSLKEFSKLYSVETLDLRSNKIANVSEVQHIAKLPCLENLILTGNPVSLIVDYRIKVLELFDNRASEICLDNEKPNQKEIDKVAVLQAIRLAKEGKICTFK